MPSSSAKCSAANVGPNLSSSEPEYFSLIKFKTRRRSFSGLLRFEARPALPCFQPFAAHLPIPPPQSFRLAIAQLQHYRGIVQLQFPTPHSPHQFHTIQLTHCSWLSSSTDLLWLEVSV